MGKQDAAAVNWNFTCNNPTCTKEDLLEALKPFVRYCIIADEIAPSTGTPHFQGFIILPSKKRFNPVKDFFPKEAIPHLTKMVKFSTPTKCSEYCKKDGKFIEHGSITKEKVLRLFCGTLLKF